MSNQAQAWAFQHCPYLHGAERAVFMVLANYADLENCTAWPGLERMALEAGLGPRSVWRALHLMKDDGVIVQERAGGRGQGNRTYWRLVQDKSKWTLSGRTIASAQMLSGRWRIFEERSKRGKKARVRLSNGQPSTLPIRQGKPGVTLPMTPLYPANDATKSGPHQLYDPNDPNTRRVDNQSKRKPEPEPIDPAVRELFAATLRSLELKAMGR